MQAFATNATASHLICLQTATESGSLTTESPTPNLFKRKGVIALKISDEPLSQKNVSKIVIFIDVSRDVLKNLWGLFEEIYQPILHNPNNQAGWSDLVAKDLLEKFNNFLAQVYVTNGLIKGETQLPLPPHKLTVSDNTPDKDKAHIFEGNLIQN